MRNARTVDHIETKRLHLRMFTLSDLDALAQINGDPEVMRYTGDGKPVSREDTEARLRSYLEHWQKHGFGLWAVVYKEDQAFIGFCGLQFVGETAEIEVGFRLAKQWWRMGLATEAAKASVQHGFEALDLDRIIGLAQPANIASQRVLENIGLRYERDAWYYNTSLQCYAIERKKTMS